MKKPLPFKRLFQLARPELSKLVAATVALAIAAAMTLVYPLYVQQIVDGVSAGRGRQAVDQAAISLIFLFLLGSLFAAVRAYLFTVAGEKVVTRLRSELYRALVRQEIGFFDEQRTGELTHRLSADTTVLQNSVTVNVSMSLRYSITGLGAIGLMFFSNWRLSLVALSVVPIALSAAGVFGRLLRKAAKEVQDALARAMEVAEETLAGIRTVRAFAREEMESQRYDRAVDAAFELAAKRARYSAVFQGAGTFAGYAVVALVVWYGGVLLSEKQMTVGALTSFVLYTFTVAFSFGALGSLYEDFQKAMGATERVFELLDRAPLVGSGSRRLPVVKGEVVLSAVSFSYPARKDLPVLSEIELSLSPGQVTALVGPSGSGKSTIAALISRFYDPGVGQISLDGVPYPELDASWLREQIGVVSQEPVLFATSIAENIRYGKSDASEEQVLEAAKAANAADFIAGFPEGLATLVGERGVKLSGGQKQRVAIARALLKNPKVLVLDEATSALDAESEHLVQEAMDRLMAGRTTLVIAHRLSTVKAADRVLVLEDGRLVQSGTHLELVSSDGLYRRLVERQFASVAA